MSRVRKLDIAGRSTALAPASAVRGPHIHPTAIIEPQVEIGFGTAVWDGVHIRGPARIGHDCIVGEKTYIAYGVSVGNCVKINAQVYICTGVTLEDSVMVSAGVVFTNDRYPRAFAANGGLADSAPNEDTLQTSVERGATLGAGAVIGPGIVIGAFAMVGMGSVVVNDVPPHGLAYGNPARFRGFVCICGAPLPRSPRHVGGNGQHCVRCRRRFRLARRGTSAVPVFEEGPWQQ